jgi:hypothetical protein
LSSHTTTRSFPDWRDDTRICVTRCPCRSELSRRLKKTLTISGSAFRTRDDRPVAPIQ